MAIKDLTKPQISEILNACLTPSKEIVTPERLLGREAYLRQIERAFNSEGRSVFIHGDRGVGKTSLAVTAAALNSAEGKQHIYVPCGSGNSFGDIMQAVGHAAVPLAQRMKQSRGSGGINAGYLGTNIGANLNLEYKSTIPKPTNVLEALDIIAYVASLRKGRTIVVVDEFDRLTSNGDKTLFAELIKNLPTRTTEVSFIFCGIGQTVDDILGAHQSAGRYFESVQLEKLHHNYLWDIIESASERIGIDIPHDTLVRIGLVSDGFPHFVHLIGECMFWAMYDSPRVVTQFDREYYDTGIKAALEKTEPTLRLAYQRATEKTKNKLEYEEALWALADRSDTRRQITQIFEQSYLRILKQRPMQGRTPLTKEQLNQRLLSLRKESHGKVVVGHGSGWFSFNENVLRGYVRLKAETEKVELKPDTA